MFYEELEPVFNYDVISDVSFTGSFQISNVQPQANGESSKVKVKVRVNNHGIFNVQSASMVEKLDNKGDEPESMETDAKENEANENTDVSQSNEEQQNEVSWCTKV